MSNSKKECDEFCNDSCNNSECINVLIDCFFSLPPKQLSLLASLLGILFIDKLDLSQQNVIGNFIVNVGQIILVAAAQGEALKDKNSQAIHTSPPLRYY